MALQTALLLAPTAARIGANLLGKGGKKSAYEKQLFRMADIFGSEASVPLTESRAFKSGMSILDEKDKKSRRAIDNTSAVTGATDEAKIANVQASNENLNRGIQRLLDFAARARDRNQARHLHTLGTAEQARQGRIRQRQDTLGSILQPAGEAASSFAMADLFGPDNNENLKKASATLTDLLQIPGGSSIFS